MTLILKFGKPEGMGLEVHHDAVKIANSLEYSGQNQPDPFS